MTYRLGWRRDLPDHRDFKFSARPESVAALPNFVDLRTNDTPILDQGNLGSCTAHAAVAAFEWLQKARQKGKYVAGSRLFIYKESRDIDGEKGDVGSSLRSAAKAMANYGVPPEKIWPYIVSRFDVEPPASVKKEAVKAKSTNYWRVDGGSYNGTLINMKTALAAVPGSPTGLPVMFGFTCYDSAFDVGSSGMIPIPRTGEQPAGGHAIIAMGYDNSKNSLLIKNSWGTAWGMRGYGYLPYWYVENGLVADCWSVGGESELGVNVG